MPKLQFDENHIRSVIDRVVDRTFRMDFNWDWPGGVAFYGVAEAFDATGKREYNPSFMIIEGSLRDQLSSLVRLQSEAGLWHTVLTDETSYLETSGSSGIAAALTHSGSLHNKYVNRSIAGIPDRISEDGAVQLASAGTAVMDDIEGCRGVSAKRVQSWGQGLALVFLADVLRTGKRVFS